MIYIKNKHIHIRKEQKGFAVLFAVLTSSLLVTIGISIYGISIKELTMSTSAKDSQTAFYAADSARECALYWDNLGAIGGQECYKNLNDEGVTITECFTPKEVKNEIKCNGNAIIYKDYLTTNDTYYYQYYIGDFFDYDNLDKDSPKADVRITKMISFIGDRMSSQTQTTIDARGRNTGIEGRRVERGIVQQSGIYDGIQ